MSKHVMPRSRHLVQLKMAATAVLVVAFTGLFVGGATGLIGSRGDGSGNDVAANMDAQPAGSRGSGGGGHHSSSVAPTPTPTEAATPVVTDVPAQTVKDAKKLKRSLAWLRRGLADETTFRVATFNVLGNSHTAGGGNARGFASGTTRMGMAWSLISQADLDVIGFQELEDPQYSRFRSLAGSNWDLYPGPTLDRGSIRDSIAWRSDKWDLVEANSIAIPYFGGDLIRRPVIKLKNKESGREVWFFNVHNPADTPTHGNNTRWRAAAVSTEIRLANELSADGTPVVFTGDYNDREAVFCPMVGGTSLEAANGGSNDGGCAPPGRMDVDWIFGSGIQFSGFVSASQGIVGRVSDHPFVYAQAYIPEEPLGDDVAGDVASGDASPSATSSDSSGN